MNRFQLIGACIVCAISVNSWAEDSAIFSDEDWLELASSPNVTLHRLTGEQSDPPNYIGYQLTATESVTDLESVASLTQAMKAELDFESEFWALCFTPRHAISFQWHRGTTEFLICYECSSMRVYHNFERVFTTQLSGKSQRVFDAIWKKRSEDPADA